MMDSWEALDPISFRSNGAVTSAFSQLGKRDFRSAGQYIQVLPYGRNSNPGDPLIVSEGKPRDMQHKTCTSSTIGDRAELGYCTGSWNLRNERAKHSWSRRRSCEVRTSDFAGGALLPPNGGKANRRDAACASRAGRANRRFPA